MISICDEYQFSSKYRRAENQDRCFSVVSHSYSGQYRNIALYAVCDGISNANGAEAADLAIQSLYQSVGEIVRDLGLLARSPSGPDGDGGAVLTAREEEQWLQSCLSRAIMAADARLREKIECGTTLSLAAVFNEHVYAANVGDSPIYLMRWGAGVDKTLETLYICHNEAGALVREGKLSEEKALTNPGRNRLFLAAGVGKKLSPGAIALHTAPLSEHNILLLGSDGALSVFSTERLAEILRGAEAESMYDLCAAIFEAVEDTKDARDNFTLIVSRIEMK